MTRDNLRAVALSLGLHAFVVGILLIGLLRTPSPQTRDAPGAVIQATLVDMPSQPTAAPQGIDVEEHQARQDVESSPPSEVTPQVLKPDPNTLSQAEPRRTAGLVAEKPLQQPPSLPVSDSHENVEQAELERQPSPQDERAQPMQVNMQPQEAMPPVATSGTSGIQDGLLEKYKQATLGAAMNNWMGGRVPERVHCKVRVTQVPGGQVTEVKFLDCPLDAVGRNSVEQALRRTPLPYAGFESVFLPQWDMDSCYPFEACAP